MSTRTLISGIAVAALALTACTGTNNAESPSSEAEGTASSAAAEGSSEATTSEKASDGDGGKLTVITHSSFVLPEELLAQFEEAEGVELDLQQLDDAGAMVNQLILTKDSPMGDAVFGIDNTFASRAEAEGIIEPYTSEALEDGAPEPEAGMTPVDFGEVCVNADLEWFASDESKGALLPETLEDLTKPEYKGLFVTPSPATSSPGLAFLFASVGEFGEDGWVDYWQKLKDNEALVVSGWTEAYNTEFSGGEGDGDYPLVLSYSSSPAFTIGDDGKSTTQALAQTCFRQVEYAGVLAGAENPDGAKKFVDFLLSEEVQAVIPDNMYMYPANPSAPLPESWETATPDDIEPIEVDSATIDANREAWIQEWAEKIG